MVSNNLSDRISVRVKRSKSTRNARNLAAFLAQRAEIESALKDGWALRQIWETLHEEGKITFGYGAFCRRVNRALAASKVMVAPPSGVRNREINPVKPSATMGFKFKSTPNKEELL
jgi:Family of unknown function (DUF5338)